MKALPFHITNYDNFINILIDGKLNPKIISEEERIKYCEMSSNIKNLEFMKQIIYNECLSRNSNTFLQLHFEAYNLDSLLESFEITTALENGVVIFFKEKVISECNKNKNSDTIKFNGEKIDTKSCHFSPTHMFGLYMSGSKFYDSSKNLRENITDFYNVFSDNGKKNYTDRNEYVGGSIDIFKNIESVYLDDSIFDSKVIRDFKFVFPEILVIKNKKQLRKFYKNYFKNL
jgi:hypothetical protein